MSEFERGRHTVHGRLITVTSWYDDGKETWRASAPVFAHLSGLIASGRGQFGSRTQAVDALTTVIAKYLVESEDKKTPEPNGRSGRPHRDRL
jgi:hypothetical protein